MGKRFVPITRKVNLIIVGTLIIGIGALTAFLSIRLSLRIQEDTSVALTTESTLIYESIRVLMLSGRALSVQQFTENLNTRLSETEVQVLRPSGILAFRDNDTIDAVNGTFDAELFTPRTTLEPVRPQMQNEEFRLATADLPIPQDFTVQDGNNWYGQIYRPLLNTPICFSCHGADHLVRGVVSVRTDVSESMRQRNQAILAGSLSFLIITIGIGLILAQFMRGTVIKPIKRIRDVCVAVTGGDFLQQVTVRSNDEVGSLGETVNTMVKGLHERFELSKYVSSTTLSSVLEDQTGKSVELTIFFSDVRGFTAFSERHGATEVVDRLNRLLSIQTEIIIQHGGDVDKYVGDEIVALFSGSDATLRAATCSLQIQNELESASDHHDLHVGIGLNSGEVILGMVGSETRADFTVIGDNVNVASRLCDVAKPGQILISEAVRRQLPKGAGIEGPYGVSLKGKSEKQRVYKLKSLERS